MAFCSLDSDGRDLTVGPGSYKIPACGDIPREFNVHLLRYSPAKAAVHSSKAVGEVGFAVAWPRVQIVRKKKKAHRLYLPPFSFF